MISQLSHGKETADSSITFREFECLSDELQWVAKDMAGYDRATQSNCAIFAGNRQLLKQATEALKEQGIEGYLLEDGNKFDSPCMNWFYSVLKLAVSRTNQEYLIRVCKSFKLLSGIEVNVRNIVVHARAGEEDYLRSWAVAVLSSKDSTDGIRKLISGSLLPQLTEKLDFRGFQKEAFIWFDELNEADSESLGFPDEYRSERSMWEQLTTEIEADNESVHGTALHALLREIDRKFKPKPVPENGTPCLTLNSSTTMKFDHVYIIGFAEGLCPRLTPYGKRIRDSELADVDIEMHEERRNCFLALTRARKSATLTCSNTVNGRKMKPSRFISEMGLSGQEEERFFEDEQFKRIAVAG